MSVNYTQLFAVMEPYIAEINTFSALVISLTEDKSDLDDFLGGYELTRLGDGLSTVFSGYESDVQSWIGGLIGRATTILTDDELVGQYFSFGTTPSIESLIPVLYKDMVDNSQTVTKCIVTIGTPSYDMENTSTGKAITGSKLDGVTAPAVGALVVIGYAGVTTEMVPDEETLTFTCISDSENGEVRGSEQFNVTGTLGLSSPYSSSGENVGQIGIVTAQDNTTAGFLSNESFDNWTTSLPDDWTVVSGVTSTNFEESTNVVYGDGSSFKIKIVNAATVELSQIVSSSVIERNKSYFMGCWARKTTTGGTDLSAYVTANDGAVELGSTTINPTTSNWTLFSSQVVIPSEIADDFTIGLIANTVTGNNPIEIDNIFFFPCEYISGIAVAIISGPDKFIQGDVIKIELENDNGGKIQEFFRKALKTQLPSSVSPTISESLLT